MLENRFGTGMDRMPDWAFRGMSLVFSIRDWFVSVDKLLDRFELREGQVVVDYGCGPGSYISRASELVGRDGVVYAVDIQELAVKAINRKTAREGLYNVTGVHAKDGRCPLEDNTADLVYALDMFHMVSRPTPFLQELNRITKSSGVLYIDDGHQPRENAREKIVKSNAWDIVKETNKYMKCTPRGCERRVP